MTGSRSDLDTIRFMLAADLPAPLACSLAGLVEAVAAIAPRVHEIASEATSAREAVEERFGLFGGDEHEEEVACEYVDATWGPVHDALAGLADDLLGALGTRQWSL